LQTWRLRVINYSQVTEVTKVFSGHDTSLSRQQYVAAVNL